MSARDTVSDLFNDIEDIDRIEQDIDEIKNLLRSLVRSQTNNGSNLAEYAENALLFWPGPSGIPAKIDEIDPNDLVATIPQGRTEIDFTTGTVTLPNRPDENLSNKLNGLNSNYVHSIFMNADNHVWWAIDDEQTGQYIDQFRGTSLPNVRAKKLVLFAFEPTTFTLFASTTPGAVPRTTSPQRSMERVTNNGTTKSVEITVDDSWSDLKWTNEEDILNTNPQPLPPLHTMNLSNIGATFRNTGNSEIAIAVDVKETIYEHWPADNTIGFVPLPNYTESNPTTIPATGTDADKTGVLSWSGWGHHFLKFRAKTTSSGTTSKIAGAFLGKTG